MILPIGTDVRLRHRPWANWALIAANVLVFAVTNGMEDPIVDRMLPPLNAAVPSVFEYLTYQFRHGDLAHLLGNMLFLWIFGGPVCDRMGALNYILFYLASGVVAGVVFVTGSTDPMVGASGAIAAVTTAFLALYPRVHITVLLWMVIVTTFQLPAMVLIVMKIILWDNVLAPRISGGLMSHVAFSAHLGGYAFGFAVTMLLLAARALPRNQFDMLALWGRWGRRTGWSDSLGAASPVGARPISAEAIASRPLEDEPVSPLLQLREDILDRLYDNDVAEALRLYERALAIDPGICLPRDHQLAIANHLARTQRHASAIAAYESFLTNFQGAAEAAQVHLLVGMIYRRHMRDFARAVTHLQAAVDGLYLDSHRALALEELTAAQAGVSA